MKLEPLLRLLFVCALGLFVAGCDNASLVGVGGSGGNLVVGPENAGGLRLQSGDKLKITVYGEDKLSGEYEIDPGGDVSLPLAGTVHAAGLTKAELEQVLVKKFYQSKYLKNPKVSVEIGSFRPFYVLGEVEKPGEYPYKGGLNVVSAIAVAGGNTYRASKTQVFIQHAGEQGFSEYPFSPSVPVYPGDLIKVPERYF